MTDISYSDDMLADPYVGSLDGVAFRALLMLVRYAAHKQLPSKYSSRDPDGLIDLTDDQICRVVWISKYQWKKAKPKVAQFFDETPNGWQLKHDWIKLQSLGWKRPAISAPLRSAVMQRDGYRCIYCGTVDGPFHVDHIVPVVDGGTTNLENLVCACRNCNSSKRDKDVDHWISLPRAANG